MLKLKICKTRIARWLHNIREGIGEHEQYSSRRNQKFNEEFFSSLSNTKGVTCGSYVTVNKGKNKREVVVWLVCSAQIHCPTSIGKMYMSCSLHFLSIASLHNTLHNPEFSLHISHITILERWVTMEVGYDTSIELSRQNRIGDTCYSGLFVDTTINISWRYSYIHCVKRQGCLFKERIENR